MYKKKAQTSYFVIAGILLVIIVALIFYSKFSAIETITKKQSLTNLDFNQEIAAIKQEVESCIADLVKEPLYNMGEHGGTLKPKYNILYLGQRLNVFCYEEEGRGCVNTFFTLDETEDELSAYVEQNFPPCTKLDMFKKRGYQFSSEHSVDVDTIVDKETVTVTFRYPLVIDFKDFHAEIDSFASTINLPLGRLYGLALDIANSEATKGTFDIEVWMKDLGYEVEIERHRPYPDIVYILKKETNNENRPYSFKFALKGRSTVGAEVYKHEQPQHGCCKTDNYCYKNTPETFCRRGQYEDSSQCGCEKITKPEYSGCCVTNWDTCSFTTKKECDAKEDSVFYEDDNSCGGSPCTNLNCESTYDYVSGYNQGPARKDGESWCVYDGPVGRGTDYVGTRHYKHYCIAGKEYVEECRDYREELCAEKLTSAGSRARCRPNRWYDCALQKDDLSCSNKKLRDCYWFKDALVGGRCVPAAPPGFRFWEGDSAKVCSIASENIGELGMRLPKSWAFSKLLHCQRMGDCGNYRNIADDITEKGFFNPSLQPESWLYWDDFLVDNGMNYIIDVEKDISFINPDVFYPQGSGGAFYSTCGLWEAPNSGVKCGLCSSSKFKPCTEYRCKSLGQSCIFESKNGVPFCYSSGQGDNKAPVIKLVKDSLPSGFTAKEMPSNKYSNAILYKVEPTFKPFWPISFAIVTDELTRCLITLETPNMEMPQGFNAIPFRYFGQGKFSTRHFGTVIVPSPDVLQTTRYELFMKCFDKAGNQNDQVSYLVIDVEDTADSKVAPRIISTNPSAENLKLGTSTGLSLYLNRPFTECRASTRDVGFDEMELKLPCSASLQDISFDYLAPFGSYICNLNLNIPTTPITYYFLCKGEDSPLNIPYPLRITS